MAPLWLGGQFVGAALRGRPCVRSKIICEQGRPRRAAPTKNSQEASAVRLKRNGLFGPELEFAVFVDFGFGLLAACDCNDVIVNALAHFTDRFRTVDDTAGRQIEVVTHALEHSRV